MGFERAGISSPLLCNKPPPVSGWNIFGRNLKYVGQHLNDFGGYLRILEDFGSFEICKISVDIPKISVEI